MSNTVRVEDAWRILNEMPEEAFDEMMSLVMARPDPRGVMAQMSRGDIPVDYLGFFQPLVELPQLVDLEVAVLGELGQLGEEVVPPPVAEELVRPIADGVEVTPVAVDAVICDLAQEAHAQSRPAVVIRPDPRSDDSDTLSLFSAPTPLAYDVGPARPPEAPDLPSDNDGAIEDVPAFLAGFHPNPVFCAQISRDLLAVSVSLRDAVWYARALRNGSSVPAPPGVEVHRVHPSGVFCRRIPPPPDLALSACATKREVTRDYLHMVKRSWYRRRPPRSQPRQQLRYPPLPRGGFNRPEPAPS